MMREPYRRHPNLRDMSMKPTKEVLCLDSTMGRHPRRPMAAEHPRSIHGLFPPE
jgi:hypothetical protein